MYKAKDLRDQSIEELEATCVEARRKLFDLTNKFKGEKKRDVPHGIKHARKDIARLLTVITEKRSKAQNF